MSTAADLTLERDGDALVARLRGEVDMTNASFIREELTSSVPNDASALVIDLSDTLYVDSAAIEVLFELSRRLGRRRQDLRLVVPAASPLRRLLTLTDVGAVAPMHESLAEALEGP
ncbi:MAG: STAS domain-containing protein [Chloroflexi bacterium]|nr:STAS domain-containing protein [Chloroflexota bacterium]